jgi:hypothetical protein
MSGPKRSKPKDERHRLTRLTHSGRRAALEANNGSLDSGDSGLRPRRRGLDLQDLVTASVSAPPDAGDSLL